MKKEITIIDEKLLEEFMSIFAIGLIECLSNKLIDSKRAEQWLFSPVIAYSLKKNKFSKHFINAMQGASEIDVMAGENYYDTELKNIKEEFMRALKSLVKSSYSFNIDFIEGLI